MDHFAGKSAISLENVTATLDFVGVTPLSQEAASARDGKAGTGRHQTAEERKSGFHSREKENTINFASASAIAED